MTTFEQLDRATRLHTSILIGAAAGLVTGFAALVIKQLMGA